MLTDADLAYLRSQLGSTLDVPDLTTRYERLGNVSEVAREVLEQRLADLLTRPASFSAGGDYSENRTANIAALEKKLAGFVVVGGTGPSVATVVGTPRHWAR